MFNFCYKKKNIKKLGHTLKKITGRNNTGKIVLRHRGGGVKKRYRVIDFKHVFLNMPMLFLRKEYDPYRTSFIFLAFYLNGFFSYKPLMEGFIDLNKEPIFFVASYYAEIKKGNSLPIEFIPIGSIISNLELRPGGGSSLIRSAGSYGQIIAKGFFNQQYVLIQLCSGEEYLINKQCFATLGRVSNQSFHTKKNKKSGDCAKNESETLSSGCCNESC